MKFGLDNINSLKQALTELATGLTKLTFGDNFRSFEIQVDIPPATEISIRNQLTKIPTKYIIVKQVGNALVTAGATSWTSNYVYMQNHDASNSATVRIIFME